MNEQIVRMKLWVKYLLSQKTGKYTKKPGKKIVIALAADYGNLGDVAITYAQKTFLQKHFPEYTVVEFPISETFTEIKSLKSSINKEDIITIVGGGNIGDMYDDIECCRQFLIRKFPSNKIIVFPQTIDFSETNTGRKALRRCVKVYGQHKNLHLCVREEMSYIKYKDEFRNRMILTPDIVMSVEPEIANKNRQGILVSFRNDKEALIDSCTKQEMICQLGEESITYRDTHIGRTDLTLEGLYKKLFELWDEFSKHEIVITDRLHGMIFSYITKTPCVVLPNNNHKILSCFKWIEEVEYIRVVNQKEFLDSEFMKTLVSNMRNKQSDFLKKADLTDEFNQIINTIKK